MQSQNTDLHKNSFEGGLNKDVTKNFITGDQYFDAQNLTLVDTNKFLSLRNIQGTTDLTQILNSDATTVLGVFQSKYKIGTTSNIDCLTIFTAEEGGLFNIFCFDTVTLTLYNLFEIDTPTDYLTGDSRSIDGILYPENGLDILYFTDFYGEIRKLRCEISLPYTVPFLNEFSLSLTRKGAIGDLQRNKLDTGGSLLCGTYQFAYQLISPTLNKYTKFSLLSLPMEVFNDTGIFPFSSIGVSTDKRLLLDITPSEDELTSYTHFRLAVIENIYPEGVSNLIASITETIPITDYLISGVITAYPFANNLKTTTSTILIDEIVVDLAAIETVKTLTVRRNRLIGGNIKYKDLTYNNGTPTVQDGLVEQFVGTTMDNTLVSGIYLNKGYFRDEVYRFAISYFDEFNNFSPPKILDMSAVVDNTFIGSGSFKDMKFPSRKYIGGSTRYSILNSSDEPVNLGLILQILGNHPTWSKGFVILRVKRKENILWQSPLVPMVPIYGIGALDNYPVQATEQTPPVHVNYPSAQPMGPNTTYFPMNFFYPKARSIVKSLDTSGAGDNTKKLGEVVFQDLQEQSLSYVFPPQTMYSTNSKYIFNSGNTLSTVDAAVLSLNAVSFSDPTEATAAGGLGKFLNTSVSGTSHAIRDIRYYYDSGHTGLKPNIRSSDFQIIGYKDFDNLTTGFVLNGKEVFTKENLVTTGISWDGFDGENTQRGAVINLTENGTVPVPINYSGSLIFAGGAAIAPNTLSTFIPFTNGVDSGGSNTIEIVNCLAGLPDDRYGSATTFHEYIYTGTKVVFSNADLPNIEAGLSSVIPIAIMGGDCVISRHIFKTADTTYGVLDSDKTFNASGQTPAQLITSWTRVFKFSGDTAAMTMPVQFKNCAQYLELYIESTYNGQLVENPTLTSYTDFTGVKVATEENTCRTPLIYNYNINSNKENDQKIFVSSDLLIPNVISNKARIIYSDEKVYQSGIEGFDIFRVLNIADLDETYGGINKLSSISNDLYALQDAGIYYIGVGERSLEQTDGSLLSVKTGDVIGNLILIDTKRGCQNLAAVVNTGHTLYFPDQRNKAVYALSNRELNIISDNGMQSEFRTILNSTHISNDLLGIYDILKKEYWLVDRKEDKCYIFNENYNKWTSNYSFGINRLRGGIFTNKNLYLIGSNTTGSSLQGIVAYSMYTGANSFLLGQYVIPSVTFIVNPANEFGKTFDELLLVASDKLNTLNLNVDRESSLGIQTVSGLDLSILETRGEGNYRIKTLFDSNEARLRGNYMTANIEWITDVDNLQVNLNSVLTKYRQSQNIF